MHTNTNTNNINKKYIFDLDGTLWNTTAKVWLINKKKPSKCLMKIEPYIANLYFNNYYAKDDNFFTYNGMHGFLPKEIVDQFGPSSELGLSFREMDSPEFMQEQLSSLIIHTNNILSYNRTKEKVEFIDDIDILTARSDKQAHQPLLDKLEDELNSYDITINNICFVHEPENYVYVGSTSERKLQYILEILTNYKLENGKFIDVEMGYDIDSVYFFDDDIKNIDIFKTIDLYIDKYINASNDDLVEKIRKTKNKEIFLYKIETNVYNPYIINKIEVNFKNGKKRR